MPIETINFPDQGTVLNALGLDDGNNVVQVAPVDGHFILIDGFPIDLALSENHSYESEVSEYPVESGSDITDNIRPKPITVTLEGLVSDSPLQQIRNLRTNRGKGPDAGVLPSTEAYLRLLKIRENREPVTIMTSLNIFESMALKSLTIPRTGGEPHALRFTATFVQIEIVTTNRAQRVAVPRASFSHNLGHQSSALIKIVTADATVGEALAIAAQKDDDTITQLPRVLAGGLSSGSGLAGLARDTGTAGGLAVVSGLNDLMGGD